MSNNHNDWLSSKDEGEGQLSLDVFQDNHNIYILAPIAGAKPGDVDISITDEVLTIRGERQPDHEIGSEKHFTQECYWGPFSRSYILPVAVNADESKAILKDGMLSLTIPKDEKVKTKSIPINAVCKEKKQ